MPNTLALAIIAAGAFTVGAHAAPVPTDDAALARIVQDRTAGKPRDCIRLRHAGSTRIVGRTAVIFDSGGILYVNRPSVGAASLSESTTLVTRSLHGEICNGDAVGLLDTASRLETGVIFLGKFVPYHRVTVDQRPPERGGPATYR